MGMPALQSQVRVEVETIRCDLSRHLSRTVEQHAIRCVGTRVSQDSLHIVSYDELTAGTDVNFHGKEQLVKLTVLSCRPDASRTSVFHISLKLTGRDRDLLSLFEGEGLLQRQAPRLVVIGDSKVSIEVLREAVAHAGACDPTLLRLAGELTQPSKAYPLEIQGMSVIAVLPASLPLADVLDMQDEEIFEKVVILSRKRTNNNSRWTQSFP